MEGEVLGVNTAIISPNGGSIGIGFSMASNVVSKVVYQLEKYGETRRGWLGVSIQDVSDDIAAAKDLDSTDGALVTNTPDGPAKIAGVKVADVIISFDNQLIKNTRALVKIVGATEVGKIVKVTVMRNGEKKVLEVTVGHREQVEASLANDSSMKQNLDEPLETEVSGMIVSSLTKEWKDALKLEPETTGVVVISVEVDSAASEKGIVAGDLIIEANQEKVSDMKQFNDSLNITKNSGKSSILLLIRRNGNQRFLALPIK
jgi:serine protease Do